MKRRDILKYFSALPFVPNLKLFKNNTLEKAIDTTPLPYKERVIEVLCDNQKKINSIYTDVFSDTNYVYFAGRVLPEHLLNWNEFSLNLIKEVYSHPDFIGFDIASVQPMSGPCGLAYYFNRKNPDLRIDSEAIKAETKKWDIGYTHRITLPVNAEVLTSDVPFLEVLAQGIALETSRKIIEDMRANLSFLINCYPGDVENNVNCLFDGYKSPSGVHNNWMVMSPSLLESLFKKGLSTCPVKCKMFKKYVWQNRFKIITDSMFPVNKILLGHKGDSNIDADFTYLPFVPFMLTPCMLKNGFLTRYGKLINGSFSEINII